MIVISVGASEYPFDRLIRIIDEICDEGILDGKEIIAQIGSGRYIPKNYKSFSLIGREEFQQYVDKAEIIITHAGTGCVVPPLIQGKKIIIFPRLLEYKEHLDNHQLELCEIFVKAGFALCAKNKEELIQCLKKIERFTPNKFMSNKKKFNEMIINYIEKM